MAECIFCEIAAGNIPSTKLHEDDQCVAFKDIAPAAPTHLLVIPREHLASLDDADEEHGALLARMLLVAKRLAGERGLDEGYRVVINRGAHGGQTVDHLHIHVLGGRPMTWPPG
ncbi:MAG: histidine triad nucleotide-binding protein [Gemmatimonadota bacterium]|jgi:histidine triad (HIT) family protein|nr:histidine triad nucleotide-binding protein [Gemmatimonadota bacterium]MDP6528830.1 histidine triad nucleotide-binding protein [Gemmatimonadota bacterium]MDP7031102.1 histidine triad nucleotide-binding protein [Gemmatimonadota bacterium]